MVELEKECDALASAYREIDRLRAGVVDLKAIIRSLEAQKTMALTHGTVPQNSTQVLDFIGVRHEDHVCSCHSVSVAALPSVQDIDSVSII
jgi:hypothetical protein